MNKYHEGQTAEDNIQEFLEKDLDEVILNSGNNQRIFFVAANYRKEVTSTVLWLLAYGIHIQCYKVTPFIFGEEYFLNVEQIIPTPEAEDFMIGMSAKEASEKATKAELKSRHKIRLEYWGKCLEAFQKSSCDIFDNISPSKGNWVTGGSGVNSVPYCMIFGYDLSRVQLNLQKSSREENKFIFDYLFSKKDEIEEAFGHELIWSIKEGQISSYIKYEQSFDGTNRDNWPEIIDWHVKYMTKLEEALQDHLNRANRLLKEQK